MIERMSLDEAISLHAWRSRAIQHLADDRNSERASREIFPARHLDCDGARGRLELSLARELFVVSGQAQSLGVLVEVIDDS